MTVEPWNDSELERRQKMRRVAMLLVEGLEDAALAEASKLNGAFLMQNATLYAEGFKDGLTLANHRHNDCRHDCIYCDMENGQ